MAAPIPTNTAIPRMTTRTELLTLTQWLSPAYPVGAFAYSHGLEQAIASGWVAVPDDLADWLAVLLESGSGRNDAILLHHAHAAPDAASLTHLSQIAFAIAGSAGRQLESRAQGEAFCRTTAAIWGGDAQPLAYPVAVGGAAGRSGIDATLTVSLYLHAMMSNLVSAAQRLMKLGQTEAQAILANLSSRCAQTAADTATATLDDLHSIAFLSDIAAMRHESLQPRIFRT